MGIQRFDIVIIGAGIHGAACARVVTERGFSCLVLEQYSAAAQGTSSRSSKLIHGGLRYLETAQFNLVRECLRERARLLAEFPELVREVAFYIPIYAESIRRPWQIASGLLLYQILGGKGFHRVPKDKWRELDGIRMDGLQAVFRYTDAGTDDAALTRAVLRKATRAGAVLQLQAQFVEAVRDADGYLLRYHTGVTTLECRARVLINAAGPWVNQVLDRVRPAPARRELELVAGAHIVIPGTLQRGIYYLESPSDRRAVFAQPWQGNILMGTTERPYHGAPEAVAPTAEEIEYLLGIFNHYFRRGLRPDDIQGAFAGLRVLPATPESPFARTRETILQEDDPKDPHLFTIYGGKLTSHHATAMKLLSRVTPLLHDSSRQTSRPA